MRRCLTSSKFMSRLVLASVLCFLAETAFGQFIPALPPIADPRDTRFVGVREEWSTPNLSGSTLSAVPPLSAYVDERSSYSVELVSLQWRWGDPIDVYVLLPKGIKKPPVILYLYTYPSDTDTFKDETWQKAVTSGGFAAVGFVSALTGHRYHDRPMREWFISELQECLATSAHDVQMILDYLARRDDLDMSGIGMFGQGSGATIGILASAADPRIKVLDVIDPWGDWPVWMRTSGFVPEEERLNYVKPEFLEKVSKLDPVNWIPKVQARSFRFQDAIFEPTTPQAAKDKLRASVPATAKLVLYKTPEDFNAVVRAGTELQWLRHELRALPNESHSSITEIQTREEPVSSAR